MELLFYFFVFIVICITYIYAVLRFILYVLPRDVFNFIIIKVTRSRYLKRGFSDRNIILRARNGFAMQRIEGYYSCSLLSRYAVSKKRKTTTFSKLWFKPKFKLWLERDEDEYNYKEDKRSCVPGYYIQELVLSDSIETLDDESLSGASIQSVVIPDSVLKIGHRTFLNCTNLEHVVIPKRLTTIGEQAFMGCSKLQQIIIPNSVTEVGQYAFANCRSLQRTVISEYIKIIKIFTFKQCVSLSHVKIPKSVQRIEYGSFSECENLIDVNVANDEISIDPNAFVDCKNLESIFTPHGLVMLKDLGH